MEKYTVTFGSRQIEFAIQRKNVKNLNLNVRPDMTVVVSANETVPFDQIRQFVKKKRAWITKSINYFQQAQPESAGELEYVSGESVKYLGKQYRLKIIESPVETVKHSGGFIYIHTLDRNNYQKKKMLFTAWFREMAFSTFKEVLEKEYAPIKKYGISEPKITIKTMKARWGSCLRIKNTILLNQELLKAPKYCIEYVILHELLHFIYNKHNDDFYGLLNVLMPDWKERKQILDLDVIKDV